jgi:hypothetical protein
MSFLVTRYKLTNNFAGLVTSGLGPDVASAHPVTPFYCKSLAKSYPRVSVY